MDGPAAGACGVRCGGDAAAPDGRDGDVDGGGRAGGEIRLQDGSVMRFKALPPNVLEILEAGGLVPKLRKELAAKRPA